MDNRNTGIILNIKRFSLYDGPGIRTTVFLKGCPLRCAWCSNPESLDEYPQLSFENNLCTDCLLCINSCDQNALLNMEGRMHVEFDICNACGNCIDTCAYSALKIYGRQSTVEEVMKEVEKDTIYYNSSNGGLTLSGGEPMYQFEFTQALLRLAKEKKIHTCIETSGYALTEEFEEILPFTDLFLYDYKLTDDFYHKRYTKKSNELIIKNLHYLNQKSANIVLRCIIIPSINDHEDHFNAIVDLSNRLKQIQAVEIIPYHDFGRSKYKQLGMGEYPLDQGSVSSETAELWLKKLKNMGCRNVRLGS